MNQNRVGGRFMREGLYIYLWLTYMLHSRNQYNVVKQVCVCVCVSCSVVSDCL